MNRHPFYLLAVNLGLADLLQLTNGPAVAALTFTRGQSLSQPTTGNAGFVFNSTIGGMLNSSWESALAMIFCMAVNRLVKFYADLTFMSMMIVCYTCIIIKLKIKKNQVMSIEAMSAYKREWVILMQALLICVNRSQNRVSGIDKGEKINCTNDHGANRKVGGCGLRKKLGAASVISNQKPVEIFRNHYSFHPDLPNEIHLLKAKNTSGQFPVHNIQVQLAAKVKKRLCGKKGVTS
uniref:Uncharacterized protein n=1 Tax=Romanomermis culicivorax TaxID=13658 RepID=A0A915KRB3_ROMCU